MAPRLSVLLLALALSACEFLSPTTKPAPEPTPAPSDVEEGLRLVATSFDQLPGWQEDSLAEALPALQRSCRTLLRQPDDKALGRAPWSGKIGDWRSACESIVDLQAATGPTLRNYLAEAFQPFRIEVGKQDQGLITGYYEAALKGHISNPPAGATPLWGKPRDLVRVSLGQFREDLDGERLVGRLDQGRLVPYYDRDHIETQGLAEQAEILAWAEDPVEAHILHIQGSGRVFLPNGEVLRIGFAASNGLPFTGVGRLMLQRGLISRSQAHMPAIRAWLKENPEEAQALMRENRRFIFFREIEGEGPIGAQGVALTPGRSLAVDPKFIALGLPLFLETRDPVERTPINRLVVAQDVGAAIKGEIRGDYFWGSGEAAFQRAGRMKEKGKLTVLLPKGLTPLLTSQLPLPKGS